MSKAKEETAIYSDSLSNLILTSKETVINVTDDISEFNTRGIVIGQVTAFEASITVLEAVKSDNAMVGLISDAVASSTANRDKLLISTARIRGIASDTYGAGTGTYNGFGFDGMDGMSDSDLYTAANFVGLEAAERQPEMLANGLTVANVTAYQAENTAFFAGMMLVKKAKSNRIAKTQERIKKANAVSLVRSKFCNTGKSIFFSTDHTKYELYVMNDGSGVHHSTSGVLKTMTEKVLDLTVTVGSNEIVVENLGDDRLLLGFVAVETDPLPAIYEVILPNTSKKFTATDAGYLILVRMIMKLYNATAVDIGYKARVM